MIACPSFSELCYIFIMKSKILQKDHEDLIKLIQSLSPEKRLEAFYRHSQLLIQLSLARKEKEQDRHAR